MARETKATMCSTSVLPGIASKLDIAKQEAIAAMPSGIAQRGKTSTIRAFQRHSLLFIIFGLLIYVGLYIISEQLVYKYAQRNRFYMVKTAQSAPYDYVILGASHAAVFDYEDMNRRLEEMTGKRILNLSVVGGGITVNRLLLEYFVAGHQTANVLYVIDSFLFYSREWNEERLQDAKLFYRAPFDPQLAWILLRNPASRSVALDYLVGFSKINNPDRFKIDISDDEATRFSKTYRPVKQIDEQRVKYLYPEGTRQEILHHYLAEFEDMIRYLHSRGIRLVVMKPPIPERIYRMLPNEGQFDNALKAILERNGVEFYDFSLVGNDEQYFFNPDHLNRAGVLNFFENYLKGILTR
jgi:hypothetical protein